MTKVCPQSDDPAGPAARAVDWEGFLNTHNPRYEVMVKDLAQGRRVKETFARFGFSGRWGLRPEGQVGGGSAGVFWRARDRGLGLGSIVEGEHHGGS